MLLTPPLLLVLTVVAVQLMLAVKRRAPSVAAVVATTAQLTLAGMVMGVKIENTARMLLLALHLALLDLHSPSVLAAAAASAVVLLDHPTQWYEFPFPNVVASLLSSALTRF